MYFVAGTGSKNSGDNYALDGMYNLTADSEIMFINAVNYMLKKNTTIVYVCSVRDIDQDDVQDDLAWEAWLEAEGYTVDFRPGQWSDPLDANDIAELETADLIIASRGMSTGEFDGSQTPLWNGLSTPIICTNAWMVRSNRWKWMNSGTANKDAGAPWMMVENVDHPIFADIETIEGFVEILDPNVGSGHTSFLTSILDVGNGSLLASSLGFYITTWIAEWHSEVEYYDGAGEIPAGHRLLFMAGTQDDPYESPTGLGYAPVDLLNLNDAGKQMFLNAISYMLMDDPYLVNGSFELPGTGKTNNWDGGTNGKGTFPDVPGWVSDEMAVDSGVESSASYPATDGEWTGFMKGSDASIYQLTRHVLAAGEVVDFSLNVRNNWAATTVELTIYVDDAGVRLPIATSAFELTDDMVTYSVSVAADDVPDAIGKRVGVEINNVTVEGGSWLGMDEAVLTVQ